MNDINQRIDDCTGEINMISRWISHHPLDSNVRFLVAYAVLKASGTIEVIFKTMFYNFLSKDCGSETRNFLEKNIIDLSCNPNTGNIGRLLGKFAPKRKDKFDEALKETKEKSDLNSLVSLRNDIAHGRTISQSIKTVKIYYESGLKILKLLDQILYQKDEKNDKT